MCPIFASCRATARTKTLPQHHRVVDADVTEQWIVTSCPSLSDCQQKLGQSGSCLVSCHLCLKGLQGQGIKTSCGTGWHFGGCHQQFSVPIPEPSTCASSALPGSGSWAPCDMPCLKQQSSAVCGGGNWGTGSCPSGGTWAFLPPLPGTEGGDHGFSPLCSIQQSLVAPVPVMGNSFSFSALLKLWKSTNTDTQTAWTCLICDDTKDGIAYAMPCGHHFCLGCLVRWVDINPTCPLCRAATEVIRFSLRGGNDYLQTFIANSEDAPRQEAAAPAQLDGNNAQHAVLSPAPQGAVGTEAPGGLLPHIWAELFQRQEHLLDPVLPWLRQELSTMYGPQWWRARTTESYILHALCLCGLDEALMARMLQPHLQEYTARLVQGVSRVIVQLCSEEAHRLLHSLASGQQEGSSAPSSSSTSFPEGTRASHLASSSNPEGANMEEEASTSEATLHRGSSCPPPVTVPVRQQQSQKSGQVATAGASAHSPSDPSQAASTSGCRWCPKRKASEPPGYSGARKRPRL